MLFSSIRNLMYKQMNGRLADALLYLSSEELLSYDVFSLLSRREIADFAGISTESTVKLLKSLEKDHIIKLIDKNIIMLNRSVLEEIGIKG